jgi:hypothetical protein
MLRLTVTNTAVTLDGILTPMGRLRRYQTASYTLTAAQFDAIEAQLDTLVTAGSITYKKTRIPDFQWYDIRDYGAVEGPGGTAATTAAFEAIFAELTYAYFPTVAPPSGETTATIFIPSTTMGWYVDELTGYIGSPGAALHFLGEQLPGRQEQQGSVLVYDGAAGGTMLDLQGINGSTFRNIAFNGNSLADKCVWLRQYWNVPNASQVGSSGVKFYNCNFVSPRDEYGTVLVAAGKDDDPPNTLQSSEYSFHDCRFQGSNYKQGWGFKALMPGNTKNFVFENCNFTYLYRGIEANSGYLFVKDCNGANIGYDQGAGCSMIYTGASSCVIMGGGMENGSDGYAARFLTATQGTPVTMMGVYLAGTTPGDDYMLSLSGPSSIISCDFEGNSRTASKSIAWAPSTAVREGQERKNGSYLYTCTTAGTTAGSGGPTGTGTGIVDGTAEWDYTNTLEANTCKVLCSGTYPTTFDGLSVENCKFSYRTTALVAVPVFDGSGNPTGASIGPNNTDYARSASHVGRAFGCKTGLFGSGISTPLPDYFGADLIVTRDQIWNNNTSSSISYLRNANGVYVVTIPFSVVAAATAGRVDFGFLPKRYKVTDCIVDVTQAFAGPGIVGVTAEVGLAVTDPNAFLLSFNAATTAQYGVNPADRGAELTTARASYISNWTANTDTLSILFTAGAGSLASLNAGSCTVYIEGHRLGA